MGAGEQFDGRAMSWVKRTVMGMVTAGYGMIRWLVYAGFVAVVGGTVVYAAVTELYGYSAQRLLAQSPVAGLLGPESAAVLVVTGLVVVAVDLAPSSDPEAETVDHETYEEYGSALSATDPSGGSIGRPSSQSTAGVPAGADGGASEHSEPDTPGDSVETTADSGSTAGETTAEDTTGLHDGTEDESSGAPVETETDAAVSSTDESVEQSPQGEESAEQSTGTDAIEDAGGTPSESSQSTGESDTVTDRSEDQTAVEGTTPPAAVSEHEAAEQALAADASGPTSDGGTGGREETVTQGVTTARGSNTGVTAVAVVVVVGVSLAVAAWYLRRRRA